MQELLVDWIVTIEGPDQGVLNLSKRKRYKISLTHKPKLEQLTVMTWVPGTLDEKTARKTAFEKARKLELYLSIIDCD